MRDINYGKYIFILSYSNHKMLQFYIENDTNIFHHRFKLQTDVSYMLPYRTYDLSNQPQDKQELIISMIQNINKSDIDTKLLLLGIIENSCKLIGCNQYNKFNENISKYTQKENI